MTTPLQTLINELEALKEGYSKRIPNMPINSNRRVSMSARIGLLSDTITRAKQLLEVDEQQRNSIIEENKILRFMVENGLGWEDMKNDISPMP
jgi:hypothetical protein